MDDESRSDTALFPERVGDRLRAARIKAGLDLKDIATRTRVPLRHLTAIETGDYTDLPSATYCAGFTKAFARAVGEDEVALSQMIREEMGQLPAEARYEPSEIDNGDTGAVPSRKLAWTAAGIGLFVLGIYGISRVATDGPADPLGTSIEAPVGGEAVAVNAAAPASASVPATGEVVLTAKETVWARVYDANDKVLFEKEMAAGERYLVPADANNPQIRTGRADLITVTVGGKEVAALGPAEKTVKDVGISAAALAARPPAVPPPSAAAPIPSNSMAPATGQP